MASMDLPEAGPRSGHPEEADTPGRGSNRRARGYSPDGEPPSPYARLRSARLKPPARVCSRRIRGKAGVFFPESSFPFVSVPRPISVDNPDRAALPSTERQSVHARLRRTLATLVVVDPLLVDDRPFPSSSRTVSTVVVVTRPSHSGH